MAFLGNTIAVVLPVYNAEKTIAEIVNRIPSFVDYIIAVDDDSKDTSCAILRNLNIIPFKHNKNLGYGANQKTCYDVALNYQDVDIIAMIHPDGQHFPEELSTLLLHMICDNQDFVIGSRFQQNLSPMVYGMPYYKYLGNILLTKIINQFLGMNLSDANSGYRIYRRQFLQTIPYKRNSNGFEFDAQILIQAKTFNFSMSNSSVSTNYSDTSSSISFLQSIKYTINTIINLFLHKIKFKYQN